MQLSDRAYRAIKEKIVTLELPPLSVIDEQSLMEELALGRTPIREALLRLAHEDLVIIVPRRGMFVADISITDLQKIFEVRVLLEGFCARLAAERAGRDQLREMEEVLRELEEVNGDDYPSLMSIDERSHRLLYEATDNEFLAYVLNRFYDLSLRLWYLSLGRLDEVRDSIEQHWEILTALKERDASRAEALQRQHVSEFQQEVKALL